MEPKEHADQGWDNYQERVLRNEGRLQGLELLVAETREADRKLIEQRSDSLASELERRAEALLELVTARADAVLSLSKEERQSDRRELELITVETEKRGQLALVLLREVYDTALADQKAHFSEAIAQNYTQSQSAIHELELRRQAATEKVEQMVRQWRESDREARELFSAETTRHLEQLNHNNERISSILSNSVTRELWQSEKDAAITREGLLRDQIITLDRAVLSMTPIQQSDKAHAAIREETRQAIAASAEVLSNKIGVVDDKVSDLKTSRDTSAGKSQGYTAVYAWAATAITVVVSVIIVVNLLLN